MEKHLRQVISKKTKTKNGIKLQQVVYLTENGKNHKGKKVYISITKHEKQ